VFPSINPTEEGAAQPRRGKRVPNPKSQDRRDLSPDEMLAFRPEKGLW
jgi:hypothetical protein